MFDPNFFDASFFATGEAPERYVTPRRRLLVSFSGQPMGFRRRKRKR